MSGGRPRDPQVTDRIITTATTILATNGLPGFTADQVADTAGIGKASLYRRWRHLDELLIEVVEDLGVVHLDLLGGNGTLRGDVEQLLTAATTGRRAMAEVAVLPRIGLDERLQRAHARGPHARLLNATARIAALAQQRGEPVSASRDDGLLAAVAYLQQRMAVTGRQAHPAWITDAVEHVALPALTAQRVPA